MRILFFSLLIASVAILHAQPDTSKVLSVSDMGDRMQISIGDSMVTFTYEEIYFYYLQKGVDAANEGDFKGAISLFELSLLYVSTDAQAYYNNGLAHFNLSDYDDALEYFDKAIQLDPLYSEAYNQRGITMALQGDFESSIPEFQKAIDLKPNEGSNYHNKAVAHLQLGQMDEACALLQKAFQLGYEKSESLIFEYCP